VPLVVEDDIGEPAMAFHAAHDLDLLEQEAEVGVELRIVEDDGAVLSPFGDHYAWVCSVNVARSLELQLPRAA
jgi:hypothetical protein